MFLSVWIIVLFVIYVLAFEHYDGSADGGAASRSQEILPFQVLFRDLPGSDQRVFRALQEGSIELLRIRGAGADWPAVDELASQGIPPFAPDVLDKRGFAWTQRRSGLVTEYLGRPSAAGAPAFLLVIREPDPVNGERADPVVVDEEHRLLPDGTLLHVTYWMHPAGEVADAVVQDPALVGWRQIRVKTLFEEAMP